MRQLYGTEIVKRIREFLGEEIPAVIFTDDESDEARDAIRQNNCIFLRKPQEFNTLTNQLSKMFT